MENLECRGRRDTKSRHGKYFYFKIISFEVMEYNKVIKYIDFEIRVKLSYWNLDMKT